jgi:hypothetical protein
MKVIADGKLIRAGLPNMRQALFFASNTGDCLNAKRLEVLDEAAKPGKTNGGDEVKKMTGQIKELETQLAEKETQLLEAQKLLETQLNVEAGKESGGNTNADHDPEGGKNEDKAADKE